MDFFWLFCGLALVLVAIQAPEIAAAWRQPSHCQDSTPKPKDPAQPARDAGA